MKRKNFNIKDRKFLITTLSLTIICIFTLTIAYSALNAVLTIQGNAEITASTWDIYLDNPRVTSGSATTDVPEIKTKNSVEFSTTLNLPGDFYEFTVDVVNNGSIDAMIENVIKTPELTTDQAKFLKYEITYQNGESITTKQTLAKDTTMPIKVRIEYRKDLNNTDLLTGQVVLDLSLTLEYIQSDGTGSSVSNNGVQLIKIISGDYDTVGSEICIGEECFYVISNTEDTVTMFSKYNLFIGNQLTSSNLSVSAINDVTGIQDSRAIGSQVDSNYNKINFPWYGMEKFSDTKYWWDVDNDDFVSGLPNDFNYYETPNYYVYNSSSKLYSLIENYKVYLENKGVNIKDARLIKVNELQALGCNIDNSSCSSAPSWVYSTSFWTGTTYCFSSDNLWSVYSHGGIGMTTYTKNNELGVRPVITISKS